jgi:hypothetical protein
MSNSNYCQYNIKFIIDKKTGLLRNSSNLGTVLFIITMRPEFWQNSACVSVKDSLICMCYSAKVQLWPTRRLCIFLRDMLGGAVVDFYA